MRSASLRVSCLMAACVALNARAASAQSGAAGGAATPGGRARAVLVVDAGAEPTMVHVETLDGPRSEASVHSQRCASACSFELPAGRAVLYPGAGGSSASIRHLGLRPGSITHVAMSDGAGAHGPAARSDGPQGPGVAMVITGTTLLFSSLVVALSSGIATQAAGAGCEALRGAVAFVLWFEDDPGRGLACERRPSAVAMGVSGVLALTAIASIPAGAVTLYRERAGQGARTTVRAGLSLGPDRALLGVQVAF